MKKVLMGLSMILLSATVWAAGEHAPHSDAEADYATGPQGGRLLSESDFSLEITIYESGVPPEVRVFAYQNDKPVKPDDVTLNITLHRLGEKPEEIAFQAEDDYLFGEQTIVEPHSFEVEVEARYDGNTYQWRYQSFEGRTQLNERLVKKSGIQTETAAAQTIATTNTLFGVIDVPEDRIFRVHAPYLGTVESVDISTGDRVEKGQPILRVKNQQTLQSYRVNSPATGEVTKRAVTVGEHTGGNMLVEIADLSKVWVALSMFPQDIEQLRTGMAVTVFDLHGHERASGELTYIAPQMSGGHIARARAVIDNSDGYWRPGMHVKAEVSVDETTTPVAVKRSAIQNLFDRPVVFIQVGEIFEARPVDLGRHGREYVEVINGLSAGMEYVTENSYLLKADILKDGASHSH